MIICWSAWVPFMMQTHQAIFLTLMLVTMSLAGCTDATVNVNDEDNDGVVDSLDVCPNTPANVQIDSNGCAIPDKCPDFKVWDDMREEFENFGGDVQTDGRSVIVGAPHADDGAGKAFVFWCKTPADGWLLEDELVVTSIVQDSNNDFGHSVSILGDYAIVGDPSHDLVFDGSLLSNAGAAFVFKRGDYGIWTEIAMLQETIPNEGAHFGWSVDISASELDRTGEYDVPIPGSQFNAVVGAPTALQSVDDSPYSWMTGAAYFFTTNSVGAEFAEVIRLESSTGYIGGTGQFQQQMWQGYGGYGHDVAIFESTAVVGSPIEKNYYQGIPHPTLYEHGAAYVFVDLSTTESVETIEETYKLTMPDDEYCIGLYGESINADGEEYVYSLCDNNNYFGHSVDIDNDSIVVGAPGGPQSWSCTFALLDSNGAAYIFEADKPGLWDESDYVKLEPSVSTEQEYGAEYLETQNHVSDHPHTFNTHLFGWEVSADRNMIIVASKVRGDGWGTPTGHWYGYNDIGTSGGSSYLFYRDGYMSWDEVAIISLPDIIYPPVPLNYNGYYWNLQGHTHAEVAIGGNYIVVGSQWDDIRPISWVQWGVENTPNEYVPEGWNPQPDNFWNMDHDGQDTGSVYICWFDEIENVYCDWTEETNPGGTSYQWGMYSVSESNESIDEFNLSNLKVECPYQDANLCRINGYLYSEEIASLYHNATPYEFSCENFDKLNRTSKSFNYSFFMECFEVVNVTSDNNSSNGSNDGSNDGDGVDNQTEDNQGCTDKTANNYDEGAEVDDGSCTYNDDEETGKEEQRSDT